MTVRWELTGAKGDDLKPLIKQSEHAPQHISSTPKLQRQQLPRGQWRHSPKLETLTPLDQALVHVRKATYSARERCGGISQAILFSVSEEI